MNNLALIETGLVNIYNGRNEERVVSGRELHEFLEIRTPYHKWMPRMLEYGFAEGEDFVVADIFVPNSKGGRQSQTDHHMRLDMSKEIAMIQRNEKGKMARQYFIEVEKKYQKMTSQPPTTLEALQSMINNMVEQERRTSILELEQKKAESKIINLETEFHKESSVEGYVTNGSVSRGLGIFSASDKPHAQFIDAVAFDLGIYNTKVGYEDEYIKVIRQTGKGGVVTGEAYYSPEGETLIREYVKNRFKPAEKKYVRGAKKGQFNTSTFTIGDKTYRFNESTQRKYDNSDSDSQ